ncbi:MAG: serine hydrolase [Acidimicrobiales bacterium]
MPDRRRGGHARPRRAHRPARGDGPPPARPRRRLRLRHRHPAAPRAQADLLEHGVRRPRRPPGPQRRDDRRGVRHRGGVRTARDVPHRPAGRVARPRRLVHRRRSARFAGELLRPTLLSAETLAEATTVQYPELAGILPGIGPQKPNDWGLGFEIRGWKTPHWTGRTNSPKTFGHFGAAGSFLWVDPAIDRSLIVLTDRNFGPWALSAWPPLADAVVAASSR